MATRPEPQWWLRRSFSKTGSLVNLPNLIAIQKSSYDRFLNAGLSGVVENFFPIRDSAGRCELQFLGYELEPPKFDIEESRRRGISYTSALRATLRLVVWDVDEDSGTRSIRDIKEQEVYMGDIPLMTENGTFVVSGTERVVVSQMHRSPGVFFDHDHGRSHASGKILFSARVIPYRGSWLDFEFDAKDHLYVRIDRRRKLPATTLLMALDSAETQNARAQAKEQNRELAALEVQGMSPEEILLSFYDVIVYHRQQDLWKTPFSAARLKGQTLARDVIDVKDGQVVAKAGQRMTARTLKKITESGLEMSAVREEDLLGLHCARDIIESSGLIAIEAGSEITPEVLTKIKELNVDTLETLHTDNVNIGAYVRNTLVVDRNRTREQALLDIYRVMRPGEPPTQESVFSVFRNLFFDPERYDLSAVGRVKINQRLELGEAEQVQVLTKRDIVEILRTLCRLRDGHGEVDDIDHLGNRRVRSVGELVENQYRIGLARMERAIRERMAVIDVDSVMPNDLVNSRSVGAAVREFFGSSQLSQFMDQTNPLAEITHKRRLSALGPGGLTRDRAGFEVRDVHATHYGRICPIETPEGPNIGLINSLATYAKIDQHGFIKSPYRRVKEGQVGDEVIYLTATEEWNLTIAQANAPIDSSRRFTEALVACRKGGDYIVAAPEEIDLMDFAPMQLVSAAASLIPFLENDDANRALMGSNMQRQAVPLLRTQAPLVGTGLENLVARDSGACVLARRGGTVEQVDATRIVVRAAAEERDLNPEEDSGVDVYRLRKFRRSNQSTCINQRAQVYAGDQITGGQIIADGHSIDQGELALGQNILVAFMPWHGYNFEDSILVSERVVREDLFTSIHIDDFEITARDTKLGQEDITRDIPNVSEDALRDLDEVGIISIGATVSAGDILVGRVTPKGDSPMTPEEKLLRTIFGEKASDVRDTSLRVPPGVSGTVVDVRIFTRRGVEKDERAMLIERSDIDHLARDRDDERAILTRSFHDELGKLLLNQIAVAGPKNVLDDGMKITVKTLKAVHPGVWRQFVLKNGPRQHKVEALIQAHELALERLRQRFSKKSDEMRRGDDLQPGVMKMVKVFIAVKRKLQPGDKVAGRHGNKGVISRIVPIEDMPYTEDGTPIDILLNPLGVPSRMNIGQILETHLGWACHGLGRKIAALAEQAAKDPQAIAPLKALVRTTYGAQEFARVFAKSSDEELIAKARSLKGGVPAATPVFEGAKEGDISSLLEAAGLSSSGQVTLIDGRSGEPFDRPVTIGYLYILKLHHLVDDKIHARSIGPYSMVTQQPLGGKAQFGGQRFGEMEVWALEAYGAAHTLQEILTVKSDDVSGRQRVYEAIVRAEDDFESGMPESFNVLVKELRSLGLDVEFQ